MDHLTGMAVFAKVVETGSFTKAAILLGLSKSAVSKQIANLEKHLATRLLNRTTRRLSLTETGEVLYTSAKKIAAEAEAVEAEVRHLTGTVGGRLKVAAPMTFGQLHLAPFVAGFMNEYPDIELVLHLNDRFVDLVEESYDVAIRIGAVEDSSLIMRQIARCRFITAASPDYLRRYGTPKSIEELAQHRWLRYDHPAQGGLPKGFGGIGKIRRQQLSSDNGDFLIQAAINGAGIFSGPTFMLAAPIARGDLEIILPDEQREDGRIAAIYPSRRHLNPNVRAFIDFLVTHFGGEAPWDKTLGLTK